jgi:hypothetical protein
MRAKTQKSLSNRSLITTPTDEASLFPAPTLARRSSFAELSSGDDANGRPSSASMELFPRRPQTFPRARYVDFSSPAAMQCRGGRENSTRRSGGGPSRGRGHGAGGRACGGRRRPAPEGAGGAPPCSRA